jgi:protein-disulfide isomerase
LKDEKILKQVNADMEDGRKVGVKSTPTFYVNGQLISGAQEVEVFAELIDEELAK